MRLINVHSGQSSYVAFLPTDKSLVSSLYWFVHSDHYILYKQYAVHTLVVT